jgi:hypothetical protein
VGPAGDRGEGDRLDGGIPQPAEVLAAKTGGEFLGAVEPVTCQRLALEQSLDAVDSWPLGKALYQSLLHGLRKDVSKSLDLGGVFLGDDGLFSAARDVLPSLYLGR